jgi:hypothetical protein
MAMRKDLTKCKAYVTAPPAAATYVVHIFKCFREIVDRVVERKPPY